MERDKIRLLDWQLNVIRNAFKKTFLINDHLWIFGSRVRLNARGGDIDLYVETSIDDEAAFVNARAAFYALLMVGLGEQKIDIVINRKSLNSDLPIYHIAQSEGVRLL